MSEPHEANGPVAGDGRPPDDETSQGRAARPGAPGGHRAADAGPPGSRGGREEPHGGTPVDEPSGAQGTGGTGRPVTDEPGTATPKPAEAPGRARRRAVPERAAEAAAPGGAAPGETGEPAAQAPVGWLPRGAEDLFGPGATAACDYALLTVDVPPERWIAALETARDELGCTYFDWLSAVDEPGTGLRVCAHVAALPDGRGEGVRRMLVRTTVPHEAAVLPTATAVYAGAAWHERETYEMFGVAFTDHPHLVPLLLPDGFEGHPLRKDFVLAARVAKAWPGAKEPGETGHGGPRRRQMLPPGVPDPNEWGPLKGQLPSAPSRSARGRAAAGGDRPARRTRSASAGSASQRTPDTGAGAETPRPPRRSRSVRDGSASQRSAPATGEETGEAKRGGPADAGQATAQGSGAAPHSADAPWHHAQPAFDDDGGTEEEATAQDGAGGGEDADGAPRNGEERGGDR